VVVNTSDWDANEYIHKTQIEIENRRDVLFSNDKLFIEKNEQIYQTNLCL
jgi:hypothetical protein